MLPGIKLGKFKRFANKIFTLLIFDWFQGILLLKGPRCPDGTAGGQKIARLWVHEVYRVFYDRLVDEEDRATFFKVTKVRFLLEVQMCSARLPKER